MTILSFVLLFKIIFSDIFTGLGRIILTLYTFREASSVRFNYENEDDERKVVQKTMSSFSLGKKILNVMRQDDIVKQIKGSEEDMILLYQVSRLVNLINP